MKEGEDQKEFWWEVLSTAVSSRARNAGLVLYSKNRIYKPIVELHVYNSVVTGTHHLCPCRDRGLAFKTDLISCLLPTECVENVTKLGSSFLNLPRVEHRNFEVLDFFHFLNPYSS